MKKNIRFNESQAQLIVKSLEAFRNETLKTVAKPYFGGEGTVVGHSKCDHIQCYSRFVDGPILTGEAVKLFGR